MSASRWRHTEIVRKALRCEVHDVLLPQVLRGDLYTAAREQGLIVLLLNLLEFVWFSTAAVWQSESGVGCRMFDLIAGRVMRFLLAREDGRLEPVLEAGVEEPAGEVVRRICHRNGRVVNPRGRLVEQVPHAERKRRRAGGLAQLVSNLHVERQLRRHVVRRVRLVAGPGRL